MNRTAARSRRLLTRAVVTSGIPSTIERVLLTAGARRTGPAVGDTPGTHLVVCAPGAGNVGDQAMLEAVLESTTGPLTLVLSTTTPPALSAQYASRVDLIAMPALVYGTGTAHLWAVVRFRKLLDRAAHLTVVGADIMDGTYSLPASVRRSTLAAAAATRGVDVRVLGFSWSARPRMAARRALARAALAGAVLLVRDPASVERLRRSSVHPVVPVADVVFTALTSDPSAADEFLSDVQDPVALVNVSGLLAERADLTEDYEVIVQGLRDRGFFVLLVPHVTGDRADDVAACSEVHRRTAGTGVGMVPRTVPPAQVRGLTARAAVTITGRMHLAVMSLANGVPAITLGTQGKVEGLMTLVDSPQLCVQPRAGVASEVLELVDEVSPATSVTRAVIDRALPRVRALAHRNIEGLPGVVAPPVVTTPVLRSV